MSSTLEDLQSSHAMRFLCRYAKPLAESKATCLPLHTHAPVQLFLCKAPCMCYAYVSHVAFIGLCPQLSRGQA